MPQTWKSMRACRQTEWTRCVQSVQTRGLCSHVCTWHNTIFECFVEARLISRSPRDILHAGLLFPSRPAELSTFLLKCTPAAPPTLDKDAPMLHGACMHALYSARVCACVWLNLEGEMDRLEKERERTQRQCARSRLNFIWLTNSLHISLYRPIYKKRAHPISLLTDVHEKNIPIKA